MVQSGNGSVKKLFFVVDIRRGHSGREFALFARLKAAELLPTDTVETNEPPCFAELEIIIILCGLRQRRSRSLGWSRGKKGGILSPSFDSWG